MKHLHRGLLKTAFTQNRVALVETGQVNPFRTSQTDSGKGVGGYENQRERSRVACAASRQEQLDEEGRPASERPVGLRGGLNALYWRCLYIEGISVTPLT